MRTWIKALGLRWIGEKAEPSSGGSVAPASASVAAKGTGLRTVLLFLMGALAGYSGAGVRVAFSDRPTADRTSFRYAEWQVEDFEREFSESYDEFSRPLDARLLGLIQYQIRYRHWLKGQHLEDTPAAFARYSAEIESVPEDSWDRWAGLMESLVAKLRRAYPVEIAEVDLMRIYAAAGMGEEYERLSAELERKDPQHPALRIHRAQIEELLRFAERRGRKHYEYTHHSPVP